MKLSHARDPPGLVFRRIYDIASNAFWAQAQRAVSQGCALKPLLKGYGYAK